MEFHEALVRGHALWSHGQLDDAETALLSVDRAGPWYGHACVLLARVCASRGQVPFRVDHYLAAFLGQPPSSPAEREALALLEPLYRAQGLVEAADELRALQGAHVAGGGGNDWSFEGGTNETSLLPELPSLLPQERAAMGDDEVATLADAPSVTPHAPPSTNVDDVFTQHRPVRVAPTTDAPPAAQRPAPAGAVASPPPVAQTPEAQTPAAQTPAAQTPAAQTPAAQTPAAQTPEAQTPAAQTSAVSSSSGGKVELGDLFGGRYRIDALLGRGGMATVYKATDLELDEGVAIKVFAAATLGPAELERFKRELRVARRLRHPNIVQLYDLGVADGQYFITMELLDGRDLSSTLRRAGGRLPVATAVRLLRAACAGLQAAHAQGVVHRDIKPANLFVERDGTLKVMDFGIAKATVDDDGMQTRTGMVLGTPQYMAPEQARDSAHVSARCDLYALGVVAFELLCGRRPFDGGGLVSILMAHVNDPPPPPRSINAELPAGLEKVILRCLAKSPEARFSDAAALAEALRPFEG